MSCEVRADGLRLACRGEGIPGSLLVLRLASSLIHASCRAVIVDGLFEEGERVKTGESVWTLSIAGGRPPQVVVTLEKVYIFPLSRKLCAFADWSTIPQSRGSWWKHALQGHPEIDTSLVDSSSKVRRLENALWPK